MSDTNNRGVTFSAFNIPFGEAEDRNGVSLNRNSRGVTSNSSSKPMTPSSRFRNGSRGTKRPNSTKIKNIADQLFNRDFFDAFIKEFKNAQISSIRSKDNIAKINESLNALGYMCCAFNGIYSKKKTVEKNGQRREEYEPLGIPKGVYEPLKTLFQLIKRIEKSNSEYFKRADQGAREIIAELKGLYENMENNQTDFGGVKELIGNNKLVVAQFRRTNESGEKTVQQKDAVEGFVPESIDPFIQSSLCYDKYFTGLVSSIVNFVELVLKQGRNDEVTPFIKQLYDGCRETYYIPDQKDDKGTVDKNIILYCSLMIVSRIVRRQASFMASSETSKIDPASLSLLFPADKFLNLSVDPKNAEYSAGIKQDEDGIKQDKEITIGEICDGFSAKKFEAHSLAGEDEIPNSGAKHFYPKPMLDAGFEAFYLRANKHGVNTNDKESFRIGCDKNFGSQKKLSLEFDQYSNNKLEKIRKLVNLVNKSPILTEEEKSSLRRFSIPFHLLDSKRRINSNNAIVIGHLKCISQEVRKEVEGDNPSFPGDIKEDEDNKEIGGSRKNVDTGTQTETKIQAETKTQFEIIETESFTIINLGAGLDTRVSRFLKDNIYWYDIDFEDVIFLRKQFFKELENNKNYECISSSILDYKWIKNIKVIGTVIIISEGVLMYIEENYIKELIEKLSENFINSHFIFDTIPTISAKNTKLHETVKETAAVFRWGLDIPSDIEKLSSHIRFINSYNYADYFKNRWGFITILRYLPFVKKIINFNTLHIRLV